MGIAYREHVKQCLLLALIMKYFAYINLILYQHGAYNNISMVAVARHEWIALEDAHCANIQKLDILLSHNFHCTWTRDLSIFKPWNYSQTTVRREKNLIALRFPTRMKEDSMEEHKSSAEWKKNLFSVWFHRKIDIIEVEWQGRRTQV